MRRTFPDTTRKKMGAMARTGLCVSGDKGMVETQRGVSRDTGHQMTGGNILEPRVPDGIGEEDDLLVCHGL